MHTTIAANVLALQQPAKSYVNQMVYKKNFEKNAKQQDALSEKPDPRSHVAKRRKISE
ncbi:MAG: hypothetical protein AB7I18_04610 [Candidatus Berkiella sp.]